MGQPRKDGAASPAEALKRERAGTYRTADGRFSVEQAATGWLLVDSEQTNELGLPLVRGPFATLDDARAAIPAARVAPAPPLELPDPGSRPSRTARAPAAVRPKREACRPAPPPIIVRELRIADGPALRAIWAEAGFRALGDDDLSLARLVKRNPGLVLVAVEGRRVVASALGAWDGRRGWIYHLATLESHRRRGIATRLVRQIEDGLRALGCPKVNVLVRDDNNGGQALWVALGYEAAAAHQLGREL